MPSKVEAKTRPEVEDPETATAAVNPTVRQYRWLLAEQQRVRDALHRRLLGGREREERAPPEKAHDLKARLDEALEETRRRMRRALLGRIENDAIVLASGPLLYLLVKFGLVLMTVSWQSALADFLALTPLDDAAPAASTNWDWAWVIGAIIGLILVAFTGAGALFVWRRRASIFRRSPATSVVGFGALSVVLAAIVFSIVSRAFVAGGLIDYAPETSVSFSRILDFYLWYFLDMVPLFDIWDTLGVESPLRTADLGSGYALLVFRLTIVVPFLLLFRKWWSLQEAKGEVGTSAARSTPEAAIQAADPETRRLLREAGRYLGEESQA